MKLSAIILYIFHNSKQCQCTKPLLTKLRIEYAEKLHLITPSVFSEKRVRWREKCPVSGEE